MKAIICQRFIIVVVLGLLTLLTVACGSSTEPVSESKEFVLEAQAVPQTAPTPTPQPTFTPVAVATPAPTLKTEIIEPVSPPALDGQTMPGTPSPQIIPGSEIPVQAAIDDLSMQLGVPAANITVISVEAQQWSDASLGCPEEGMMYAQVITPGFLVILEANGQQYSYHTNQQINVILCEK